METYQVAKVLMRHGQSYGNLLSVERIGGYQPRFALTTLGERQAWAGGEHISQQLGALLGAFTLVRLSSSPAKRAQGTGQIVRAAIGAEHVPIGLDSRLAELHKGHRWLGGQQGRLRHKVETEAYWARREEGDWDFRYGTRLSGGRTPREVGAKVLEWINEIPPIPADVPPGVVVDMAFGHGMSGSFGVGMALGAETAAQAEARYMLPNASAIVLVEGDDVEWAERGRIFCPPMAAPDSGQQ